MITRALSVLETMRQENGLYVASVSEGYQYIWVRDTCYSALVHLNSHDGRYEETLRSLLNIFHSYEWKIRFHCEKRPYEAYEYIHPRYSVKTGSELTDPWGNAQNDAIGLFLFTVGMGTARGKKILRDERDRELIALLVRYLINLEFWHDADNGMWEENREIHASSVGACTAGLLAVRGIVDVDWEWIKRGLTQVLSLFPHESASKTCDLAQLSLVYPYRLLPPDMSLHVVTQVEQNLLRKLGTIRYAGDQNYQEDGQEAQWCLGLPWLGLSHLTLGNVKKAKSYLLWTESVMSAPGVLPELYLGRSERPNINTPLAWAQSVYIVLYQELAALAT